MITAPQGWTSVHRNGELTLTAPGTGAIRYLDRLRPLAPVVELVAAATRPAGFVADRFEPPEKRVTHEGEYAVLVVVPGQLHGQAVELCYAFVLLDDHYARITSMAAAVDAPGVRRTVEDLLIHDTHCLGRVRRRRYAYASPSGWRPVADTFNAIWYPVDPPERASRICVAPALPRHDGVVPRTLARLVGGSERLRRMEVRPSRTVQTSRLSGRRWHLRGIAGPGLDSHVVFLVDQSFIYAARLDAAPHAASDLAQFDALVGTIEPIPTGARAPRDTSGLAAQWAD
jgi:hypothetical protein